MSDESSPPQEQVTETSTAKSAFPFRPGKAVVLFAVCMGMLIGIGFFTFGYGKGASYLSNNPQTCANCHVMQSHMDSWQQSSHHAVAVCNDCHLPHYFLGKWVTKADNGFFHSLAFTMGNFKDPIQIKPRNKRVTQNACIHCHQDLVHPLLPDVRGQDMLSCVHCHTSVGHAER
ncbi:cytochrome c nitrite reductase small subunit [Allorhodopirellula solitaria]|uniref:Cytochrome c-type protein NrfH n=1 Tax=Allorhodopirellula solitaria TaxID=2527987 RepID=A0A5C5WZN2_9BACT|nr:cytochrome c nitrite reductase small subunit [Allorhodopirellula solitaria]TWT56217.1 Cytochrome c-type protein NrfH [Allorhodopirellula solitaria]